MDEFSIPMAWEDSFLRVVKDFESNDHSTWMEILEFRADQGDDDFFKDLLIFSSLVAPEIFEGQQILNESILQNSRSRHEIAKVALMFLGKVKSEYARSNEISTKRHTVIQAAVVELLVEVLSLSSRTYSLRARQKEKDIFLARSWNNVFASYILNTELCPGAETINGTLITWSSKQHISTRSASGNIMSGVEWSAASTDEQNFNPFHVKAFLYLLFVGASQKQLEIDLEFDNDKRPEIVYELISRFSKELDIKIKRSGRADPLLEDLIHS